jgi:type IV pilus assembly protein PilM
MDVMLVAVKKDIINEYTSVVKEAGLNPVVVDVNAFTLGNMYEVNYDIEIDRNVALVNIGANTINLNVLKGYYSVFTRDSSVGTNIHAEALQKEFSISFESAERLKMGGVVEGVPEEEAQAVIASASEEVVGDISRSLEYFRSTAFQEDVHEVVLSGGGALVKGLPSLLTERVGLEVKLANPFKNINIPAKFDVAYIEDVACIASVAVGLAIRRAGDR